MKRKTKRFGEGGDTDDAQARANRGESDKTKMVSQQVTGNLGGTGLKRETFSDAFARARRAGDKTFEFQGKKYGTAMKGSAKTPPSSTIETGIAAGQASEGRTRARPEDYEQAEYKTGRFENKMNRSLGRATAPENVQKIKDYAAGRKQAAADRAATARQTQAAGTTDMDTLRSNKMDASLPVDEQSIYSNFKKGGKVSSASSRADGIAQRGKTRGTMVMCGGGMYKGKK